jgi:SNF2 family DNA or RNA helicase
VIVNYDILSKHVGVLVGRGFRALVLDESHYAKNANAKRTKLCIRLSRNVPLRLLLSGTPMLNRPEELVPQLRVLDRLEDLGGYRHFMHRYAGAYRNWHERHSGDPRKGEPRNLEELNRKLRATCYVRRTKQEVLAELPAKQRAVVPVALDNRREYERVLKDVVRFLGEAAENDERRIAEATERYVAENGEKPDGEAMERIRRQVRAGAEARAERARQLVEMEALKMTAARGKLAAVGRWVEDFLESGEKLVLFGWHREIVDALAQRFGAPKITGDTPTGERQAAVDAFQEDPETRLLVANVRAGGLGLTLTAASNVAFCELGWTPAEHDQAEDRCHRIGQTDSVGAWYLLAEDTIESRIRALIERKRAVVDAATEGARSEMAGGSVLSDLAEFLQGKSGGDTDDRF